MLAQSTMQTLFRGLSRIAVFPPPSSSFLATPTMALAYRTALKTTSQNVNTSLQRGIATSASLGFNSPHRYGNGPLYRNKLSPKDASTRADVSPLRMLMFGKPGSGKGTLSSKLTAKYDVSQVSAGDVLRALMLEGTEIGRLAQGIMATGGLIPDEIMTKVIMSKLDPLRNKHWILDGFPRTIGQSKLLNTHLRSSATPLTLIVNLDVPDDVILNRINERWVHLPSGRVYNASYNTPKIAGVDDATGEPLTKRPDDTPEVFKRRLQEFYDSTSPLLKYYSSPSALRSTKFVTLTGKTSDEIWPQLDSIISSEFRLKPRDAFRKPMQEANPLTHVDGPLYNLVLSSKL